MSVQIHGIHAAAPNLCSVCVDGVQAGECTGRLFHYYTDRAIPFRSRFQLLACIDDLCDRIGYPQAAQQPRSFRRGQPAAPAKKEVERRMSKDELSAQKGRMATFVVHVMHRQNATWQGILSWEERGREVEFRSALEFLALMDNAIALVKKK